MKAFEKIFRDSFKVNTEWTDWFLKKVLKPDDVLTIENDGQTTSISLLSPYKMEFHGASVPVCYINSFATARKYRGQGFGTRLMHKVLQTAAERGDDFAVLIPANRRLYFFYDEFGFSTVFYIDEQRYTSLHEFDCADGYAEAEPSWEMFKELEALRSGAVIHSRTDFENILTDLSLSDGKVIAVDNGNGSRAMIFFELTDTEAHVLDILATDEVSAEAALHFMRLNARNKAVIVKAMPNGRHAELRSRGMARIINACSVLEHIAEANPNVQQVIKLNDPLIPTNSGIYILEKGHCTKVEETKRRITLDVNIDVLCRIIFSDKQIGDVFGLPTHRPFISLMLD